MEYTEIQEVREYMFFSSSCLSCQQEVSGNVKPAARWYRAFLGSVPHQCNLDECSSLAFGLINNNINSNYCDRIINSFKNAAWFKKHEQNFSGDNNFTASLLT